MYAGIKWVTLALVAGVLAAALAGCCSLGIKSCATTDTLTLVGADELNRCDSQHSNIVQVRFYYLKQSSRFNSADFDNAWSGIEKHFMSDLAPLSDVEPYRYATVTPGEQQSLRLLRPAEAGFLVVVANFCEQAGTWKTIIDLGDKGLKQTTLRFEQFSISTVK